ncbi:transcription factor 20 [Chanos chanos]|uniref:Transcription factor 20 n=1 Tax=Chanos chanos TaxID=29144 RepID=A0A6J2VE01_CHACN|nr:transcription factor 20-like [Chanos chanos]
MSPGSSIGIVQPENDSDPLPQASTQIQLDNAFSNTTVTLSYVTRSHVFSSLSQHSPLYVLPINEGLSIHPDYEVRKLITDTGEVQLCVDMDQNGVQQVSVPAGIATCSETYEFISPAEVAESVAGFCCLQQAHEINGVQEVESVTVQTFKALQQDNNAERKLSQDAEENGCEQNGQSSNFSQGHLTGPEEQQRTSDSEIPLNPGNEGLVILQSNMNSGNFCSTLNVEYISPLHDPVSPPATSLDEMKDVFVLPQPANSPSEANSFGEETTHNRTDELDKETSDPDAAASVTSEATKLQGRGKWTNTDSLDFNTSIKQHLATNIPDAYNPLSGQDDGVSKGKEKISETLNNRPKLTHNSDLKDSVFARENTSDRRKLPPRSGRGVRLEAIFQNIYPTRYKSSHITSTKSRCSESQVVEKIQPCPIQEFSSEDNQPVPETICTSAEELRSNDETKHLQDEVSDVSDVSRCKDKASTSDTENANISPSPCNPKSPEITNELVTSDKESEKVKHDTLDEPSEAEVEKQSQVSAPKLLQKTSTDRRETNLDEKVPSTAKKGHTPKKKRKKNKVSQSSPFSPHEPEIKLKYVNFKDDRKEMHFDSFSPFIRVELKEYPTCTVINYPEENVRLEKGKQQVSSTLISGVVPTTSCLQYGRVSADCTQHSSLVCCLCGGSANALDLGDLHGPYYPEGFKPASKALANVKDLKEDNSDSDASSIASSGKRLSASGSWAQRSRQRLSNEVCRGLGQKWTGDGDSITSPKAKRPRMNTATDDWYNAPVLPLDTSEYWIHEDCAVWTAGVFLVKGKLYGLENAVKLAKETICSTCHKRGATLGCFFKGCPNKYHYRCALRSDCVLNEENFSIKCPKHKSKSIKASSASQQKIR